MCCHPNDFRSVHPTPGLRGFSGSCCGPEFRHFMTRKERLEHLEAYKEHLENELEGLREHIQDLQKD